MAWLTVPSAGLAGLAHVAELSGGGQQELSSAGTHLGPALLMVLGWPKDHSGFYNVLWEI